MLEAFSIKLADDKLFNSLTDTIINLTGLRNDFNHAAFRDSPRSVSAIEKNIRNIIADVDEKLKSLC